MGLLDSGWLDDFSDSFETLNSAPWDNTMRYGDNHGEKTTKAVMLNYMLPAFYGFGGEAAGASSGGANAIGSGVGRGVMSMAMGSAFGGGGGQQQQPYSSPFSPSQPLTPESPYHPVHFQNNSFNPWMQNVASMGMPRQQVPGPAQHIFGPGKGFF